MGSVVGSRGKKRFMMMKNKSMTRLNSSFWAVTSIATGKAATLALSGLGPVPELSLRSGGDQGCDAFTSQTQHRKARLAQRFAVAEAQQPLAHSSHKPRRTTHNTHTPYTHAHCTGLVLTCRISPFPCGCAVLGPKPSSTSSIFLPAQKRSSLLCLLE